MNSFQTEQSRSLDEKRKQMEKLFPEKDKLLTSKAAQFLITILHINELCETFSESVDYIENMLLKQLISAIGKVVTPSDFSNYLTFHNRKIYQSNYQPQSFCFAIRRPDHDPEVFIFCFIYKFLLLFLLLFFFICFYLFLFDCFIFYLLSDLFKL